MQWLRNITTSDIPFARDDAHRFLPAMIACLIGFAALLLALAMSLTNTLAAQSRDVVGVLQIEVPRSKADDKNAMETIIAEIKRTAGVVTVETLTTPQIEGLLKPWMGNDFSLDDIPVPAIIDVKTKVTGSVTAVNVTALRTALAKVDAAIRVQDRGPWVTHIVKAASLVQALVLVVAAILIACVLGMVVLVAKTNLRLHFKTVSLLHMFGATDEYIVRQFQWNSAWLAARGACAGVLFASLVVAAGVILSVQWNSPVLPTIALAPIHAVLFVLLPVFTAMTALVVTRITVQSMLKNIR
jgi:cell division protein FtsX